MILEIENWHLGYLQLLNDCRGDGGALILCGCDVDAMCAARILCYMLRNDSIYYELNVCPSQSALQNYSFDKYDSVVLLNVGSNTSLQYFSSTKNINIYVIDHRRPVHLSNIHADNVICFWDGTQTMEDLPSDGDNLSGIESSSSDENSSNQEESSSSDDDEEEAEFDNEPHSDEGEAEAEVDETDAPPSPDTSTATVEDRPTTLPSSPNPAEENDDNDDASDYDGDAEDEGEPSKKHKKPDDDTALLTAAPTQSTLGESVLSVKTPKQLHEERRDRIRNYYNAGSFYGAPSSFVLYKLVTHSRFENIPDLLWLCMIGTTDNYNNAKLDLSGYSNLCLQLQNYAEKLFPNDEFTRIAETTYAEDLQQPGNHSSNNSTSQYTRIGFSKAGQILVETDFRLFLLRQTNLFESLEKSDYVSTTLKLPNNMGMLKEFLARAGISLQDAHQDFRFVIPKTKRIVKDTFPELAELYGLDHLEFTSFFRVTKYNSLVSALDTSYCISAVLDKEGFEAAYDALGTSELSDTAVATAVKQQSKLLDVANSIIERKTITKLSHFRYSYIEGDLSELSLTRLAKYLMDWYDWKVPLPLILLSESSDGYLVVAHERSGHRNKFGMHFSLAAESMQGQFVFDSFDSHVLKVGKPDAQKFIEQLHYLMDY